MGDVTMIRSEMHKKALEQFHAEYRRVYVDRGRDGGDTAQGHSEAVESAVGAVVDFVVEKCEFEFDREEPTDDEIYNRPGMEGGIPYSPEPIDRSLS
jgi:hypothetical protein